MQEDINLIIDTDPGQDDAAAILMAFGLAKLGELKILGIAAVAGNVTLDLTQKNARILCDWAGREDAEVRAGAERPILKKLITAEHVHGKTGLDGVELHDPRTPLQEEHAVDWYVRILSKAPERSVTIVAIGPLTNLGLAFAMKPSIAKGIKEIVIMGGAFFEPGNVTPNADFNFFVDPVAAQIVMNSGAPIKIVPLDVTHKALITNKRMDRLRELPNENGKRVADILQSYERFDVQKFGLEGGPLHDPCAVGYVVARELFKSKDVRLDVETNTVGSEGTSMVDWHSVLGKEANVTWTYDIDSDGFFDLFTKAIAALP